MRLIVIRKRRNSAPGTNSGLLRFGLSNEHIASVILGGLTENLWLKGDKDLMLAIPEQWGAKSCVTLPTVAHYNRHIQLSNEDMQRTKRSPWFAVCNGRFLTRIKSALLEKVLVSVQADVIMVNVEPGLLAYGEKVLLTAQGKVAGFRRLYSDAIEPAQLPDDWPHHLFIKTNVLDRILSQRTLPQSFSTLLSRCRSKGLKLQSIGVGGTVMDLDTEGGLLRFLADRLNSPARKYPDANGRALRGIADGNGIQIASSARLFGKVLFGRNVNIGQRAIIVGPTIIGNDVKVAEGAAIRASIVGSGVSVPKNHFVQNRVLVGSVRPQRLTGRSKTGGAIADRIGLSIHGSPCSGNFRTWPRFSYGGCLKRIADIAAALIVLILFAPILPIIGLVIKLTSRGPIFFKDRRQGMHGKAFNCLKFRTMLVGADKMQDKLRIVSNVDGPQFKIADDPRLIALGRFLRDTYIDEVPQFLNVLLGQMSVVGPRPSPESENTLCPSWRDARLSVRPGITGLWQVCGTRRPMKDFQEWIYYDSKYVRELSLRMDLWICWQTAKKLVRNFVSQF